MDGKHLIRHRVTFAALPTQRCREKKTRARVSGDGAGHRTRRESKEVLPAASCTKGTSLFTGGGVATMGANPAVLAAGMTMPLLAPRVALSNEYERQDGEKR